MVLGVHKATCTAPDLAVLGFNGSGQRAAGSGGMLMSCCRSTPPSQSCAQGFLLSTGRSTDFCLGAAVSDGATQCLFSVTAQQVLKASGQEPSSRLVLFFFVLVWDKDFSTD